MNVQRQHETYSKEYEEAALKVLRSGIYIGGQEVNKFEEEFASYEGAKYGISCGNGSDSIILALRSLGIGKGDEVITVSWTFFATAESIVAVGATPVFVDVCADTYCMNPELIEDAITSKTKAVLPVHLYGQSCDMKVIKAICKKHNLYLITDCAQSAGTRYDNQRKNTLGDIACFSFFPTKNLGGAGDGGMVLTDNEDIARACRSLKTHGSGEDGLWTLKKKYLLSGKTFPDNIPIGKSKYYNYLIGYNSRLDAIQAAILRKKLVHIEEFIDKRRNNVALFNEALKDTEYITPVQGKHSYHSYYVYALKHAKAQIIMEKLKIAGITCGTYYPIPLHQQGVFVQFGYNKKNLPVTEELSKTTFAIPVFPELYDYERNYIIKQLKTILED